MCPECCSAPGWSPSWCLQRPISGLHQGAFWKTQIRLPSLGTQPKAEVLSPQHFARALSAPLSWPLPYLCVRPVHPLPSPNITLFLHLEPSSSFYPVTCSCSSHLWRHFISTEKSCLPPPAPLVPDAPDAVWLSLCRPCRAAAL